MESIFIKVLNLSVSAGWLILAVIAARMLLKKAPRWISVLLWGIVGLRLVMPFSIKTRLSLIPSAQTVSPSIGLEQHPSIHSGVSVIDNAVNPALGSSLSADHVSSVNPMQVWLFAGSIIWLTGVAAMLIYSVFCWLRLRKTIAEAVPYKDNIWLCDHVHSPFILGVIHPKIYLPSGLSANDVSHVLAHEKAHLGRLDHIWKPIGFLLLAVYWFDPLVWAAYILLCRDIETACDEKVIADMNMAEKKAYANALVSCSERHRIAIAYPLAFGEVDIKERVKRVLNFKKPMLWIIIISLLLCAAAVVFFMTDPPKKGNTMTYEDVIRLSEKGEALSWSDFDGFEYTETGSGLYIREYKIDDMFSVYVGGGYPPEDTNNQPMYFYLSANDITEETIDIRYGAVRPFIDRHKDNTIARLHVSASWDSCAVAFNDNGFSAMINAGAYDSPFYVDSVRYLPVLRITDEEGFKNFREYMNGVMEFDRTFLDGVCFDDIAKRYNKEYFRDNDLFLVYVSAGNSGPRFSLDYVKINGDKLMIGIMEDERYTSADSVIVGWLAAVGIPKDELSGVETAEATISSVQEHPVTEVKDLTAINGLIEAKIVGNGHEFTLNDPEKLSMLESMFQHASVDMPSGCPFEKCYLSLTMQNGEKWIVYPAIDGCGIIKTSSDVFYRYSYGDDTVKDGNNILFWELFGIDDKDLIDLFWQ